MGGATPRRRWLRGRSRSRRQTCACSVPLWHGKRAYQYARHRGATAAVSLILRHRGVECCGADPAKLRGPQPGRLRGPGLERRTRASGQPCCREIPDDALGRVGLSRLTKPSYGKWAASTTVPRSRTCQGFGQISAKASASSRIGSGANVAIRRQRHPRRVAPAHGARTVWRWRSRADRFSTSRRDVSVSPPLEKSRPLSCGIAHAVSLVREAAAGQYRQERALDRGVAASDELLSVEPRCLALSLT